MPNFNFIYGPGSCPMHCNRCGDSYRYMLCPTCDSPKQQPTPGSSTETSQPEPHPVQRRVKTNRGGFPIYSQLSVRIIPIDVSPSKKHRSLRKRASTTSPLTPFRRVRFMGDDERPLKLSDSVSVTGPVIVNGNHKSFSRGVDENKKITALTKFEWGSHTWETSQIPYDKETTDASLFVRLCIYFPRFLDAMEKCDESERCLCGGPNSSVTQHEVNILGYDLFDTRFPDVEESFVVEVKLV